jgi:L-threonylcarbamoyladenylate synthase
VDRLNGFDPGSLAVAVDALRRGLVVAYPTDTLYGLAADPRSSGAVDRLFALNGRAGDKATPLIAADVEQARRHVRMTPLATRLAALFWPGPLTLVLESVGGVDPRVVGERSTVAIRVPDQPLAQALARAAEHPITSTSANPSGSPGTADPDEVARQLPSVDVLLDGGPAPGGAASTIVDATGDVPVLLRAGAVAWERVLESLGPASTPSGL